MARTPQRDRRTRTLEGYLRGQDNRRTNREIDAVRDAIPQPRIAIGMAVLYFEGSEAPDQWLLAHGGSVAREAYPELFELYGTTFGAGDGSTTFDLPDLTGIEPGNMDYYVFAGRSP